MNTDAHTIEEMKPLLRPLFAALMMLGEVIACVEGPPASLVEAGIDAGREPRDQMAHYAVEYADALLRALDEPEPPLPTAAPIHFTSLEAEMFPRFNALLEQIAKTSDIAELDKLRRAATQLLNEYEDEQIPF
jgi:hypothetical protein